MPDESKIDEVITRYVLGELSEEEERSIADKYALDPDFPDLVDAVEDDLVVAYVLNRLPPEKREQFERFFLASPENCKKVSFTEVLLRHIQQDSAGKIALADTQSQASSPSSPTSNIPSALWGSLGSRASRFALVVIILMTVGSGLWLLTRNRNSQRAVNRESYSTPLSQNEVKPAEPPSEPPNNQAVISRTPERNAQPFNRRAATSPKRTPAEKTTPIIPSFILSPGITRAAGDTNRIEIPKNAELVELKLSIDSTTPYLAYRASLQRVGDGQIWIKRVRQDRPKARKSITLKVPVSLLSAGEYLLTITGTTSGKTEVAGDYPFIVSTGK